MKKPKWLADGHPHEWNDDVYEEYMKHMSGMSHAEWSTVDAIITARRHNRVGCGFCEGEDKAADESSRVFVYDPDSPFDVEAWLPTERDPEEWDEETWSQLEAAQAELPFELYDAVEAAIYSRLEIAQQKELLSNTPIMGLTDEEFSELEAVLSNDSAYYSGTMTKALPSPPKTTLLCNCNGPGSAKEVYKTHISTCPQSSLYSVQKKSCAHDRDSFQLEDGLSVFASAYRDVNLLEDDRIDLGIYFYSQWTPGIVAWGEVKAPWLPKHTVQGVYINWPDYGIPPKEAPIYSVVNWVLKQVKTGLSVETACLGGHGRTGTMLALLLVAQGITPPAAIKRVRKEYCTHAIESKKQMEYIGDFYTVCHGNNLWRKSKPLREQFTALIDAKKATQGSWQSGYVWSESQKKYTPPLTNSIDDLL